MFRRVEDPIALLKSHFARANESETFDASRAALATADTEGRPSVRFVLVREIEASGLYFYTNYESDKARQLDDNPHAAIVWHWSTIGIQVRAEGETERVSGERSDAYFATRHRESQIGAWASNQSHAIESREVLDARVAEMRARFEGSDVPRPPHWGGYVLVPRRIEIWHEGEHRLHDRFRYDREGDGWKVTRLAP
jgi:pyridoxamine 5'-phosphate oxidase